MKVSSDFPLLFVADVGSTLVVALADRATAPLKAGMKGQQSRI